MSFDARRFGLSTLLDQKTDDIFELMPLDISLGEEKLVDMAVGARNACIVMSSSKESKEYSIVDVFQKQATSLYMLNS